MGTGGDGKNTFNISTCACFVVAGAGYKVVKHGNVSATSVSGASNVLQLHGAAFTNDTAVLNATLDRCGFAYLHAPLFASAMKYVAPIRKALPFPTIFNMLGPIVNPSQPKCQLLGVANLEQMRIYSGVCAALGIDYGIETSIDGYDEISLTGEFKIKTNQMERLFTPEELGLPRIAPEEIFGGETKEAAAEIFDAVLENRATEAQTSVVIANAALAIHVFEAGRKPLEECVAIARESIASGKALGVLKAYLNN